METGRKFKGVEGRETVVGRYCVRGEFISNKRNKEEERKENN